MTLRSTMDQSAPTYAASLPSRPLAPSLPLAPCLPSRPGWPFTPEPDSFLTALGSRSARCRLPFLMSAPLTLPVRRSAPLRLPFLTSPPVISDLAAAEPPPSATRATTPVTATTFGDADLIRSSIWLLPLGVLAAAPLPACSAGVTYGRERVKSAIASVFNRSDEAVSVVRGPDAHAWCLIYNSMLRRWSRGGAPGPV